MCVPGRHGKTPDNLHCLQECSRPGSSVGIFLKTPLLRKVAELQRCLMGLEGDKDQIVLGVLTSR